MRKLFRMSIFLVFSLFFFLIGSFSDVGLIEETAKASTATFGAGYRTEPPATAYDIKNFFTLVGGADSMVDPAYPQVLVVTPNVKNQKGGLYMNKKINLLKDFSMVANLYASSAPEFNQMADGFTFVFQNDPRGKQAIGQVGSALGAYGSYQSSETGQLVQGKTWIQNAVVAEFDTYPNTTTSDKGMYAPHIAWQVPTRGAGSGNTHIDPQEFYFSTAKKDDWSPVEITWKNTGSNSGKFTVSYMKNNITGPYTHVSSYTVDDIQKTFKSDQVYFGLTGSTGLVHVLQAVTFGEVRNPDPIMTAEKGVYDLNGNQIPDKGQVATGQEVEYRIKAQSGSGFNFNQVQISDDLPVNVTYSPGSAQFVDGTGTTTSLNDTDVYNTATRALNYNFSQLDDDAQAYLKFRVKINSNVVAGTVISNIGKVAGDGLVKTTEPANVTVYTAPTSAKFTKLVKNISQQTGFSKQQNVYPGDIAEYQLELKAAATNSVPLDQVRLLDTLQGHQQYIDHSLKITYPDGSIVNSSDAANAGVESAFKDESTVNLTKDIAANELVRVNFQVKIPDDVATDLSISNIGLMFSAPIPFLTTNQTFLNVEKKPIQNGNVVVHYVEKDSDNDDTNNIEIKSPTTLTGVVGDAYTTTAQAVTDYKLVADSGNTTGFYATELQNVYYYYDKASLLLKDYPKYIDFPDSSSVAGDDVYYGKVRKNEPNYAQVEAKAISSGWALTLKQDSQFVSKSGAVLKNAVLSFKNGAITPNDDDQNSVRPSDSLTTFDLIPNGAAETLMKANPGEGEGNWKYNFGLENNAENAISIRIPKETQREDARYTCRLTWALQSVIANRN